MQSPILHAEIVAASRSTQRHPARGMLAMNKNVDMQLSKIREQIEEMQQQVEKFVSTADVQVRRMLMLERQVTMQASLKAMCDMSGPKMMSCSQQDNVEADGPRI
jgi:hypothetical protein